jgi:hypothetical protein
MRKVNNYRTFGFLSFEMKLRRYGNSSCSGALHGAFIRESNTYLP